MGARMDLFRNRDRARLERVAAMCGNLYPDSKAAELNALAGEDMIAYVKARAPLDFSNELNRLQTDAAPARRRA